MFYQHRILCIVSYSWLTTKHTTTLTVKGIHGILFVVFHVAQAASNTLCSKWWLWTSYPHASILKRFDYRHILSGLVYQVLEIELTQGLCMLNKHSTKWDMWTTWPQMLSMLLESCENFFLKYCFLPSGSIYWHFSTISFMNYTEGGGALSITSICALSTYLNKPTCALLGTQ